MVRYVRSPAIGLWGCEGAWNDNEKMMKKQCLSAWGNRVTRASCEERGRRRVVQSMYHATSYQVFTVDTSVIGLGICGEGSCPTLRNASEVWGRRTRHCSYLSIKHTSTGTACGRSIDLDVMND
jgi:hypothetical protein